MLKTQMKKKERETLSVIKVIVKTLVEVLLAVAKEQNKK